MQWVLESLESAHDRLIVANQPYDEFSIPVFPDIIPSQTPLSGIHSALVHAQHDWVAVAACDMPFLTKTYWQTLLSYRNDTRAAVVESGTGLEPLAAIYHKDLCREIEKELTHQKAVHIFLQSIDATVVGAQSLRVPKRTFDNINRLEDIVTTQNET